MLQQSFISLVQHYTSDKPFQERLWDEVMHAYSLPARHYHTLTHLENMMGKLMSCKNLINDWDMALFALYYHDFVYNVLKKNNEEKSAGYAGLVLKQLGINEERSNKCLQLILATKTHLESDDEDINLFTDADLCILGQGEQLYDAYARQVRQEYSLYPDLIYIPGRKKVLAHFLQMPRIFKTDYFYDLFEQQARLNLSREMNSFSSSKQ